MEHVVTLKQDVDNIRNFIHEVREPTGYIFLSFTEILPAQTQNSFQPSQPKHIPEKVKSATPLKIHQTHNGRPEHKPSQRQAPALPIIDM